MQGSLQKQPQIKILPAFRLNERSELREADIDDAVNTVQGGLPYYQAASRENKIKKPSGTG